MHLGGMLDGLLERKKDISGKTGDIQIKSGVELIVKYQCWSQPDECIVVR